LIISHPEDAKMVRLDLKFHTPPAELCRFASVGWTG
jgi:hypothetical protein